MTYESLMIFRWKNPFSLERNFLEYEQLPIWYFSPLSLQTTMTKKPYVYKRGV